MKFTQHCRYFSSFIFRIIKHFIDDDGLYLASALTVTSLLAIVPLMSVSLTAVSAFPIFQDFIAPMQDFIFANFVPGTSKIIQSYLQEFVSHAEKLSVLGTAFLVVSAVLMMFTIEQAMNRIWHVKVGRPGLAAFFFYWAILLLIPVFMGLSLLLSSYLASLPFLSGSVVGFLIKQVHLLSWLPFFLSIVIFTLLYVVIPNCPVKFSHGLVGAIVAAVLFLALKAGFTFYLRYFHTYELLYGAFAIIPVFFLWVYWVWSIVLLGAEVSYALGKTEFVK